MLGFELGQVGGLDAEQVLVYEPRASVDRNFWHFCARFVGYLGLGRSLVTAFLQDPAS